MTCRHPILSKSVVAIVILMLTFQSSHTKIARYDRSASQCLARCNLHIPNLFATIKFVCCRWNVACYANFVNSRLASSVDLEHATACPAREVRFKNGSHHIWLFIHARSWNIYSASDKNTEKKQNYASATQSKTITTRRSRGQSTWRSRNKVGGGRGAHNEPIAGARCTTALILIINGLFLQGRKRIIAPNL